MADEAGPSGTGKPQSEVDLNNAAQMFEDGVKAIKDGDFEKAVQLFADVLNIRTLHYGQMAPECADAYYRYGSALLYQAQESADVFGGPMNAVQGGDGDKENDADEALIPAAAATAAVDDKGKAPATSVDEEATAEDTAAGSDGAKDDDEDGAVDGGDLQLAWENLEAARAIWAKDPSSYLKQLAEAHSQLAEINMENEAFEDALADIDTSLDYHNQAGVGDDDRRIADLQFRRSMTLQFLERPGEALESVKVAIATLERRKANAAALAADTTQEAAAKEAASKEVEDLTAFLEELAERVDELNEVIKEDEATKAALRGAMSQIAAAQKAQQGGSTSGGPVTGKTPITSPVKDLGVVGRGTKRINLAPVGPALGEAPAASGVEPAPKKRALEDLMGGGAAGDTSFGFASGATGPAGEEKKEEASKEGQAAPAVPAFLSAMAKKE